TDPLIFGPQLNIYMSLTDIMRALRQILTPAIFGGNGTVDNGGFFLSMPNNAPRHKILIQKPVVPEGTKKIPTIWEMFTPNMYHGIVNWPPMMNMVLNGLILKAFRMLEGKEPKNNRHLGWLYAAIELLYRDKLRLGTKMTKETLQPVPNKQGGFTAVEYSSGGVVSQAALTMELVNIAVTMRMPELRARMDANTGFFGELGNRNAKQLRDAMISEAERANIRKGIIQWAMEANYQGEKRGSSPIASVKSNLSYKYLEFISRGLVEEELTDGPRFVYRDIFNAVNLAKKEESGRKAKILIVGVGGGAIVFDILRRLGSFREFANIEFINKENIHLTSEEFIEGYSKGKVFQGEVKEIKEFLQYFNDNVTLHDIDRGLPYASQTFDFVLIAAKVLPYIRNKVEVLKEVKRVLRVGGIGYIDDVVDFMPPTIKIKGWRLKNFFMHVNQINRVSEFQFLGTSLRIINIATNKNIPELKEDEQPLRIVDDEINEEMYVNTYVLSGSSPLHQNKNGTTPVKGKSKKGPVQRFIKWVRIRRKRQQILTYIQQLKENPTVILSSNFNDRNGREIGFRIYSLEKFIEEQDVEAIRNIVIILQRQRRQTNGKGQYIPSYRSLMTGQSYNALKTLIKERKELSEEIINALNENGESSSPISQKSVSSLQSPVASGQNTSNDQRTTSNLLTTYYLPLSTKQSTYLYIQWLQQRQQYLNNDTILQGVIDTVLFGKEVIANEYGFGQTYDKDVPAEQTNGFVERDILKELYKRGPPRVRTAADFAQIITYLYILPQVDQDHLNSLLADKSLPNTHETEILIKIARLIRALPMRENIIRQRIIILMEHLKANPPHTHAYDQHHFIDSRLLAEDAIILLADLSENANLDPVLFQALTNINFYPEGERLYHKGFDKSRDRLSSFVFLRKRLKRLGLLSGQWSEVSGHSIVSNLTSNTSSPINGKKSDKEHYDYKYLPWSGFVGLVSGYFYYQKFSSNYREKVTMKMQQLVQLINNDKDSAVIKIGIGKTGHPFIIVEWGKAQILKRQAENIFALSLHLVKITGFEAVVNAVKSEAGKRLMIQTIEQLQIPYKRAYQVKRMYVEKRMMSFVKIDLEKLSFDRPISSRYRSLITGKSSSPIFYSFENSTGWIKFNINDRIVECYACMNFYVRVEKRRKPEKNGTHLLENGLRGSLVYAAKHNLYPKLTNVYYTLDKDESFFDVEELEAFLAKRQFVRQEPILEDSLLTRMDWIREISSSPIKNELLKLRSHQGKVFTFAEEMRYEGVKGEKSFNLISMIHAYYGEGEERYSIGFIHFSIHRQLARMRKEFTRISYGGHHALFVDEEFNDLGIGTFLLALALQKAVQYKEDTFVAPGVNKNQKTMYVYNKFKFKALKADGSRERALNTTDLVDLEQIIDEKISHMGWTKVTASSPLMAKVQGKTILPGTVTFGELNERTKERVDTEFHSSSPMKKQTRMEMTARPVTREEHIVRNVLHNSKIKHKHSRLKEYSLILREIFAAYGSEYELRNLKGLELGASMGNVEMVEYLRAQKVDVRAIGRQLQSQGKGSDYLYHVSEYNEYIEKVEDNYLDFIIARLALYPFGYFENNYRIQNRKNSLQQRYGPILRVLKSGGLIISVVNEIEKHQNLNNDESQQFNFGIQKNYVDADQSLNVIVLRKVRTDPISEIKSSFSYKSSSPMKQVSDTDGNNDIYRKNMRAFAELVAREDFDQLDLSDKTFVLRADDKARVFIYFGVMGKQRIQKVLNTGTSRAENIVQIRFRRDNGRNIIVAVRKLDNTKLIIRESIVVSGNPFPSFEIYRPFVHYLKNPDMRKGHVEITDETTLDGRVIFDLGKANGEDIKVTISSGRKKVSPVRIEGKYDFDHKDYLIIMTRLENGQAGLISTIYRIVHHHPRHSQYDTLQRIDNLAEFHVAKDILAIIKNDQLDDYEIDARKISLFDQMIMIFKQEGISAELINPFAKTIINFTNHERLSKGVIRAIALVKKEDLVRAEASLAKVRKGNDLNLSSSPVEEVIHLLRQGQKMDIQAETRKSSSPLTEMLDKKFAQEMKNLRESRGLSLGKVARLLGISDDTLMRYERFGTKKNPFTRNQWKDAVLEGKSIFVSDFSVADYIRLHPLPGRFEKALDVLLVADQEKIKGENLEERAVELYKEAIKILRLMMNKDPRFGNGFEIVKEYETVLIEKLEEMMHSKIANHLSIIREKLAYGIFELSLAKRNEKTLYQRYLAVITSGLVYQNEFDFSEAIHKKFRKDEEKAEFRPKMREFIESELNRVEKLQSERESIYKTVPQRLINLLSRKWISIRLIAKRAQIDFKAVNSLIKEKDIIHKISTYKAVLPVIADLEKESAQIYEQYKQTKKRIYDLINYGIVSYLDFSVDWHVIKRLLDWDENKQLLEKDNMNLILDDLDRFEFLKEKVDEILKDLPEKLNNLFKQKIATTRGFAKQAKVSKGLLNNFRFGRRTDIDVFTKIKYLYALDFIIWHQEGSWKYKTKYETLLRFGSEGVRRAILQASEANDDKLFRARKSQKIQFLRPVVYMVPERLIEMFYLNFQKATLQEFYQTVASWIEKEKATDKKARSFYNRVAQSDERPIIIINKISYKEPFFEKPFPFNKRKRAPKIKLVTHFNGGDRKNHDVEHLFHKKSGVSFRNGQNGSSPYHLALSTNKSSSPILNDEHQAIKRVLVIDDGDNTRRILRNHLSRYGVVDIEEAVDGQEGYLKFMADPEGYDVIFLDYNMPKKDGKEVLHLIRGRDSHIPIVSISAETGFNRIIEKMGGKVLGKPVDQGRLFRILKEIEKKGNISSPINSKKIKLIPKILIVEDNEKLQEAISIKFKEKELTYIIVKTRDEAVFLYKDAYNKGRPFGLIIVDFTLPDYSTGPEIVKDIQKINYDQVIIMTSYDPKHLTQAEELRVAFVEKDYDSKGVAETLATMARNLFNSSSPLHENLRNLKDDQDKGVTPKRGPPAWGQYFVNTAGTMVLLYFAFLKPLLVLGKSLLINNTRVFFADPVQVIGFTVIAIWVGNLIYQEYKIDRSKSFISFVLGISMSFVLTILFLIIENSHVWTTTIAALLWTLDTWENKTRKSDVKSPKKGRSTNDDSISSPISDKTQITKRTLLKIGVWTLGGFAFNQYVNAFNSIVKASSNEPSWNYGRFLAPLNNEIYEAVKQSGDWGQDFYRDVSYQEYLKGYQRFLALQTRIILLIKELFGVDGIGKKFFNLVNEYLKQVVITDRLPSGIIAAVDRPFGVVYLNKNIGKDSNINDTANNGFKWNVLYYMSHELLHIAYPGAAETEIHDKTLMMVKPVTYLDQGKYNEMRYVVDKAKRGDEVALSFLDFSYQDDIFGNFRIRKLLRTIKKSFKTLKSRFHAENPEIKYHSFRTTSKGEILSFIVKGEPIEVLFYENKINIIDNGNFKESRFLEKNSPATSPIKSRGQYYKNEFRPKIELEIFLIRLLNPKVYGNIFSSLFFSVLDKNVVTPAEFMQMTRWELLRLRKISPKIVQILEKELKVQEVGSLRRDENAVEELIKELLPDLSDQEIINAGRSFRRIGYQTAQDIMDDVLKKLAKVFYRGALKPHRDGFIKAIKRKKNVSKGFTSSSSPIYKDKQNNSNSSKLSFFDKLDQPLLGWLEQAYWNAKDPEFSERNYSSYFNQGKDEDLITLALKNVWRDIQEAFISLKIYLKERKDLKADDPKFKLTVKYFILTNFAEAVNNLLKITDENINEAVARVVDILGENVDREMLINEIKRKLKGQSVVKTESEENEKEYKIIEKVGELNDRQINFLISIFSLMETIKKVISGGDVINKASFNSDQVKTFRSLVRNKNPNEKKEHVHLIIQEFVFIESKRTFNVGEIIEMRDFFKNYTTA
ncbi:MAG: response regulator, partial [Candidatus Omnitrophica bacterium]|nr:response regulator [Candidatus Omnitrophota bacterium]